MLGLGLGLCGTLAAAWLARRAQESESGPLVPLALLVALLDVIGLLLLLIGAL